MILYCIDPTSMPKWVTFLNGSYNLNSVTHRVEKETKQDQCWLVLSRTQSSKSGVIRVSKDFHLVPTCSQHTNRPLEIPVEYRDTDFCEYVMRYYTYTYIYILEHSEKTIEDTIENTQRTLAERTPFKFLPKSPCIHVEFNECRMQMVCSCLLKGDKTAT